MKITLAEVKSLETSLSKIFDKDIHIKIAYRLSSLLKVLSDEINSLEENRVKLVKKYGEEDKESGQLAVPTEKAEEFYKEFNELLQLEIDIDFEPIPLGAFGDISLSAADVVRLDGKIIVDNSPQDIKVKKETEKPEDSNVI